MECIACARELADGSAFCHVCGTAQAAQSCAECGQMLPVRAAFCNRCGAALPQSGPGVDSTSVASGTTAASPAAERRVTSVLFADLVAYTTLAELRDSEDVRSMLAEYFDVCATIVRRYGGTVEKFIGDAVMAVWGVPTSHEDDAERAVRAGLELVAGVTALGERLELPHLSLRVGIVTGEVAANLVATDQGMVAGDPVNTAARVQSAAGPSQVWVDATTRTLTAAAVTYFDAGRHVLKGRSDPVQLFRAGAVVAARGGSQRIDGLEAALVGRERQLRLLKELFHGTEESGRPTVVVLDGQAGMGKSRLGWELEKYVDGLETAVAWHYGRCLSYGDGAAFWALSEAIRARLGLVEDDAADVCLPALDRALAELVPDERERDWLRPRVASLLVEDTREFAWGDLFAAWSTFLERVGAGDPVVLLIDDAHHADQGLLDFVDHVATNARFPLFVLLLARPELLEQRPTLGGRRATVLRIGRLPDPALRELVADLVGGLDDTAAHSLVERAEGIPLFAVETVRALIDRGDVGPLEGRYVVMPGRVVDLEQMGAPASLHALVAARLDALAPLERRVMSDASVLGESFTREGIGILAHDVADIDAVMETLQRRELLVTDHDPFSAGRGQYRFVHSVVRQVAYSTLARSDRKARHLQVAEHLLTDRERVDDLAQVIARHLLDAAEVSAPGDTAVAELRRRASVLLVTAGNRACALGAFADGLRAFGEALDIIGDAATRSVVLRRSADAAVRIFQLETARDYAREALALCDEMGDVVAAAEAGCLLAKSLGELGHLDEAIELATRRLESVEGIAGCEPLVGRLARVAGEYLQFGGRWREAASYVDVALRMSDVADDAETLAGAIYLLGVQQQLLGSVEVAHLLFAGMAEVARSNELWSLLTAALASEASLLAPRDVGRAIDLVTQSATNQAEHGLPPNLVTEANLCNWYWLAGHWAELDEFLTTSALLATETSLMAKVAAGADHLLVWAGLRERRLIEKYPGEQAPALPGMAAIEQSRLLCASLSRRDHAAAVELAKGMIAAELEMSGVNEDLHVYWPLALCAVLEADDMDALRELLDGLAPYQDKALPLAVRGHRRVGQALLDMRAETPDDDAIVASLEAGIAELAGAGSLVWQAHADEDLAAWHLSRGRAEGAEPHFVAARATYVALGARDWLARLDALEAGLPARKRSGG